MFKQTFANYCYIVLFEFGEKPVFGDCFCSTFLECDQVRNDNIQFKLSTKIYSIEITAKQFRELVILPAKNTNYAHFKRIVYAYEKYHCHLSLLHSIVK